MSPEHQVVEERWRVERRESPAASGIERCSDAGAEQAGLGGPRRRPVGQHETRIAEPTMPHDDSHLPRRCSAGRLRHPTSQPHTPTKISRGPVRGVVCRLKQSMIADRVVVGARTAQTPALLQRSGVPGRVRPAGFSVRPDREGRSQVSQSRSQTRRRPGLQVARPRPSLTLKASRGAEAYSSAPSSSPAPGRRRASLLAQTAGRRRLRPWVRYVQEAGLRPAPVPGSTRRS